MVLFSIENQPNVPGKLNSHGFFSYLKLDVLNQENVSMQ